MRTIIALIALYCLITASLGCTRTIYLPADAAAYKARLEACQENQKALINGLNEYRRLTQELQSNCR